LALLFGNSWIGAFHFMATPTWDSIGQAAINQMPTWEKLSQEANFQIDVSLEIASVRATWWAVGTSDQEVMGKVKENLQAKGKI
jgi:hypothetical protein